MAETPAIDRTAAGGPGLSGSPLERLLRRFKPYRPRRLTRRELWVESVGAAAFVLVASALPLLLPPERELDWELAAALLVGHVIASRIPLHLGAGSAVPTQIVLVPMLVLLPPVAVPALMACSSVAAATIDMVCGRARWDRLVSGIGDSWHAVGSASVLALAGEPGAVASAWLVLSAAVAVQAGVDLAAGTLREWLGRGISAVLQLRVVASAQIMDLCLTPVGFLAAVAGARWNFGFALMLLLLLAALAADRRARIEELAARLDELSEERARLDGAIRRIGDALASNLDRLPLVDVALRTAVEALGASRGRAELASGGIDVGTGATELDRALDAAVSEARRCGAVSLVDDGQGRVAMACPLTTGEPLATDALGVARRGREFSAEERVLFSHLANQARIAMENVALHDQLRRQATEDELTGLANHRRFQVVLAEEVQRSQRFRRPLALLMLDIDDFKAVNDVHGHHQGDAVLAAVARVVKLGVRTTDEPARYGGEELLVVLPDTDVEGGVVAAEKLRREVEALEFPLADGAPLRVTVSVGVGGLWPGQGDSVALIRAADAALYAAKRGGKNRTASGQPTTRFTGGGSERPERQFAAVGRGSR